jgi:hypothetical protein
MATRRFALKRLEASTEVVRGVQGGHCFAFVCGVLRCFYRMREGSVIRELSPIAGRDTLAEWILYSGDLDLGPSRQ